MAGKRRQPPRFIREGVASAVAGDAIAANQKQLQQTNDVTQMLQSFVTGLQSRPVSGSAACQGSSAACRGFRRAGKPRSRHPRG